MDNPKFPGALTVTQLNAYIKGILDHDPRLTDVYLKGEISNFKNHYSTGHYYFTLKDEGGMIRAIMFRSSAAKLAFLPEDGMKVVAHGRISAFVRDGQYQIYCASKSDLIAGFLGDIGFDRAEVEQIRAANLAFAPAVTPE